MNIGYVFDEGFSVPATVSILSLLINNVNINDINFYIFDDGIKATTKIKLTEMIKQYNRNVKYIDVRPAIEKIKYMNVASWRGRYSAYIKLLVADYLPLEVNRMMVLDVDTIIPLYNFTHDNQMTKVPISRLLQVHLILS